MVLLAGTLTAPESRRTSNSRILRGAPMRLVAFEPDDQALDRVRQLIGVAHRPPRAVGQGFKPVFLVALENLVTGLAGDAELPADLRHRLPVQQAGDEPQAFLHHRTRFPRHPHLPPKGEKCCPWVRYKVSPMSHAAHFHRVFDCLFTDSVCARRP